MSITTEVSIGDLPTGTTWYIVNPGGIHAIQKNPCYAGPDRAQALDRLVAVIAQGVDVLPGERFRPRPTDAYVAVADTIRIGEHPMLGAARLDEEKVLLVEARAVIEAQQAARRTKTQTAAELECPSAERCLCEGGFCEWRESQEDNATPDDTEAFMDALEAPGIAFENATRLDLATAPAAEIIADEKARREAEKPPLKNFAEAFERLAEHAVNNLTDDEQDMAVDMVAALTPHLTTEVSAMYFEDLMTAVVALGNAEDGEHPGDVDGQTWVERCRESVEYNANKLAGAE